MEIDIYNCKKEIVNAKILLGKTDITSKNKELILKFVDNSIVEGVKKNRQIKYIGHLKRIAIWAGKDFDKCDKEDLKNVIKELELSNLGEWSKHDYKCILKKFYKWLRGNEEDYPPEIKWLKTTVKNLKPLTAEELLTAKEVYTIIDATENLRDRALLTMFWESGGRGSELLTLRIKDVLDTPDGLILNVKGKMGYRQIPYLKETVIPFRNWLQAHPTKEPNDPLWINLSSNFKGQPIRYSSLNALLIKLIKKTGIKKRVHAHLFRKSRATFLAANGMSESLLNQYFGWKEGSGTASCYVKLTSHDLKNKLNSLHGKATVEVKPQNKECNNCKQVNPIDAKFCFRCSVQLDRDYKQEEEKQSWLKFQEVMKNDPATMERLLMLLDNFKRAEAY